MTTINNEKKEVTYTATFQLTQLGDGPVMSSLKFDPLDGEKVDLTSLAPASFQIMSELVAHYLYITGIIDEHGDLRNAEAFTDMSTVSVN